MDDKIYTCEQCTTPVASIAETHSIIPVLQKLHKTDGYSFYQCEDGKEPEHRYNHLACSKECAIQQCISCLSAHHTEEKLQSVPMREVSLHKFIFALVDTCNQCKNYLRDTTCRFSVSYATTGNTDISSKNIIGQTLDDGWCCSLDCAQKYATDYLLSNKALY